MKCCLPLAAFSAALLASCSSFAQSVPSCFWTPTCFANAWASKADVGGFGKLANGSSAAPALTFTADSTTGIYYDPTTQSLDATSSGVQVAQDTQQAPIPSASGTWLGLSYYPVTGHQRMNNGHFGVQGATRGWGSANTILEAFANYTPNFCNGAMGCYNQPNNRTYAGTDGAAAFFYIQGRAPLAANVLVTSISTVALSTGAMAYTLTLSAPLSSAQIANVLPLMKVETVANQLGYFGYVIGAGMVTAGGASIPPVSADGTQITLDGLTNVSGAQLAAITAGTQITIDVLHQIDGLYFITHTDNTDTINTVQGIESAVINDRTATTSFSTFDPLDDQPLVDGIYLPVMQDNGTGSGLGGSAFVASDSNPNGTWKRGFACRNRAQSNSGMTYCTYNAFATVGMYSVTPTSWQGYTDYALIVAPQDLGFATQAYITQSGSASFQQLTVQQITGTPATYACFTSQQQLVSSATPC